jgi:glutamate formiminotransferase/formiminotetrahydrofolate cyclodeaminase
MKIIECVPNFSEGKNEDTFHKMKDSLNNIHNCKFLNIEADPDYNRVVVTFAGNEEGVLNGAISISKAAASSIDMRTHKGVHPRLGAIDVVPFVPVRNATMEDCIKISETYADIISKELKVPVYLYELSARKPDRVNLTNIRKGEYEGLEEKLKNPEWQPDFGKNEFNPKLGAIVTGARFFLIAYNINIKSTDVKYAKKIAGVLRESGKANNNAAKDKGKLKNFKAIGVKLLNKNITQVSTNLTNYNITPLHIAFEEVKKEANRLGVEVTGSEVVGLIPLEALLQAGRFYSNEKYKDENSLVELAIEKLGLSSLNPFIKEKKIIDYMI